MIPLQQVRSQLRELRALALAERDVSRNRFVFETIDQVHQAVVCGINVRIIDLEAIARENEITSMARFVLRARSTLVKLPRLRNVGLPFLGVLRVKMRLLWFSRFMLGVTQERLAPLQ